MSRPFLCAEWRNLIMLNYQVDPALLRPLVPKGTELDTWQGRHFLSIVGFSYTHTRLLGVTIPFHRNFEEVNLRFYVRRPLASGCRRGVVFVKEVVPRLAVAAVARWFYNENFVTCPMRSRVRFPQGDTRSGSVEYAWTSQAGTHVVAAEFHGLPDHPAAASKEEFIVENHWGYGCLRDGSSLEYEVEHPRWRTWRVSSAKFEGNVKAFYGEQYHEALNQPADSVFVVEGSPIVVMRGEKLPR